MHDAHSLRTSELFWWVNKANVKLRLVAGIKATLLLKTESLYRELVYVVVDKLLAKKSLLETSAST